MAALNFPDTTGQPTDGSFTYEANGVTYAWDGEKWTAYTNSGGGGTPPTYSFPGSGVTQSLQDRLENNFNVYDFGAVGDGVTDDTVAIQNCIDYVGGIGGGTVYFPPGIYNVSITDYSDQPTDLKVCALTCPYDNVHLVGSGIQGTEIRPADAAGNYGVIQFVETPLENGTPKIFNGSISNMTLDGRYTGTRIDGETVLRCSNLSNFKFENLLVKNASYYGIGMQNGGFQNVKLENVTINTTTRDGMDIKDNGGTSYGIRLNNVTAINCGTQHDPTAPFASIDLMTRGLQASNIFISGISNPNLGAAFRLKQGVPGGTSPRGWGGREVNVSGLYIDSGDATKAVQIKAPGVSIYGSKITGSYTTGIEVMQGTCTINGSYFDGPGTAIDFIQASGSSLDDYPLPGGDYSVVDGCSFTNSTNAINVDREYQRILNNYFEDVTTAITVNSSIDNVTITGNYFGNNISSKINAPQDKDYFITGNMNFGAPNPMYRNDSVKGQTLILKDQSGDTQFAIGNPGLGFFGTLPTGKRTVVGARESNDALGSLLQALVNYGLIINNTTEN